MANKDFKTIEEQIEILRSHGLTINDEPQARDFLLHNNYYRISGYSLIHQQKQAQRDHRQSKSTEDTTASS